MADERYEINIDPEQIRKLIWPVTILLFVGIIVYGFANSFYTVQENENAVVMRFGKVHATTLPGFHLRIPYVDRVVKVNVTEERRIRLPFGVSSERTERDNEFDEEATLMLTGDLNAASVEWTVQWRVDDPKAKVLSFYDPSEEASDDSIERAIIMAARSVMNRLVGDYSIDEVLTEKRPEIRLAARQATQETLNRYNCGIVITDLQVQRIRPPNKVRPSFDAVNSAIQKRDKLENEANKDRNKLIPDARGQADQKIREAEGYAARRRAEVQGEIEALRAKYAAYTLAPEITRQRLYLDSMEKVLNQIDQKVIIDSGLDQVLPLLQLQGEGSK